MVSRVWKVYEILKLMSVLIRQFALPNPYGSIPYADLYNWMTGFALYPVTYLVVGVFYKPRSNPPIGAVLYLLFYSIHTGLIALAGANGFSQTAIIIISILYVALLGCMKTIQMKLEWWHE